jgi:hypothetical protein
METVIISQFMIEKKNRKLLKKELTSTVQIISLGFGWFCRRIDLPRIFIRLFCDGAGLIHATSDRLEVTSSSSSAEVLLALLRAAKSSIGRTALLCSSALYCSLVCERAGPWYRRAVFIGDDLAVHGSPCSCAADGQGDMVGVVRPRR